MEDEIESDDQPRIHRGGGRKWSNLAGEEGRMGGKAKICKGGRLGGERKTCQEVDCADF